MVNHYAKRFAFSMIELVFAIVIIGITVASLPIMTNAIGEGVENNLVQEAVFAASAQMNQVLSYRWDENSINEAADVNATGLAKVIDNIDFCDDDTKLKPGHIDQPLHRRCLDSNTTTTSTLGSGDGGETLKDDIDDNIVTGQALFTATASSADAYKDNYTYSIAVSKSTFEGRVNSNEAKEITVTVFDSDGDTLTQLQSYSFNIGEVDYHKRWHP